MEVNEGSHLGLALLGHGEGQELPPMRPESLARENNRAIR